MSGSCMVFAAEIAGLPSTGVTQLPVHWKERWAGHSRFSRNLSGSLIYICQILNGFIWGEDFFSAGLSPEMYTRETHIRMHTHTHARTHARTHAHGSVIFILFYDDQEFGAQTTKVPWKHEWVHQVPSVTPASLMEGETHNGNWVRAALSGSHVFDLRILDQPRAEERAIISV